MIPLARDDYSSSRIGPECDGAKTSTPIAAIRVGEALRLYAHEHSGQLPAALDDVKEVPLPIDPMTGKMFEYHRQADDQATLEGKAPAGLPVQSFAFRLRAIDRAAKEITVRSATSISFRRRLA